MILEVCAEGVEMSVAADQAGATRIELCAAIAQGGITPSAGIIEQVCKTVSCPVHVMIRPRAGDFLYSSYDIDAMAEDIRIAKDLGAEAVVFGLLDTDGMIDINNCECLLDAAEGMKKVFHRAFDMAADPFGSFNMIQELGFDVLLTSGRRQTAKDGMEVIRQLVLRKKSNIQIMAGSGVSPTNAALLTSTGIQALHFTCKKITNGGMRYQNRELQSMGSADQDEFAVEIFDIDKFNNIKNAVEAI
ncbi:MAG: copper homeostasis protein CutC [Bacteroidota bacterium]